MKWMLKYRQLTFDGKPCICKRCTEENTILWSEQCKNRSDVKASTKTDQQSNSKGTQEKHIQ